ncbi:MAG: hypothetical protein JWO24_2858 [Rhodospirillales bacterium]|jgi:hypothetical protein|nr:hypothetical protein [Rhodospirillales bacterium]
MANALALCSRALLKIGARPVASFDDGTAEAEVAAALYAGTRDALLSAHPWSFATGQETLPRLAAAPVADFAYAYQLPPTFLRALSAGQGARGRGVPFRLLEDRLHTDADSIILTHIFRPDESVFPPFFAALLAARLAAEFCLPLTESTQRAELLYKLADAEFRAARQTDSQQGTPRTIEEYPLISIRGRS